MRLIRPSWQGREVGTLRARSLLGHLNTLGDLYGVADEWEFGWGRTVEELQAEVRERCIAQTQAT